MNFLDNKYTNWYYKIIYNASVSPRNNIYTETHHIIPRCLGGNNSKSNLVVLSAREHFICHILLTKMTEGKSRHKMIHAAVGMRRSNSKQSRYINSRLYDRVKKEFAELSSIRNTGKIHTAETKKKMSEAGKGKPKSKEHAMKIKEALTGLKRGPMSDIEKEKRSAANKGKSSPNKGNSYKLTEEQKQKISEANRKRTLSPETRAKIAASLRARTKG